MKKLVGFVALVAALVLGGYYAMGILTERAIKKNIDVLNQVNGVTVTLKQYHRSWFKSEALLNWTLILPARSVIKNGITINQPLKTYDLQMPLHICHGPFIFADSKVKFGLGYANSIVTIPPIYEKQFNEAYAANSTKPSLNLSVFVSYLNNTSLGVIVPEFKLISNQANNRFEWKGMTNDVKISATKKRMQGDLLVNGLAWVKDQIKGKVTEVKSQYDLHVTSSGLYLGDADLSLPAILITRNNDKLFEMNGFEAHSSSDVKNNLFHSSLKLEMAKLFLNQRIYSSCSLMFSIKNLDATVFASMHKKLAQANQNPNGNSQSALLSLLSDLPNLLNKGAELKLSDFKVTTADGSINANMLFALPNENITNPFQLIQKLKGDGNIVVSASLLKELIRSSLQQKLQASIAAHNTALSQDAVAGTNQIDPSKSSSVATPGINPESSSMVVSSIELNQQAEQKINSLIKSGVFLPQGVDYILAFKFTDGRLTINDKIFDPTMLQM
ncbi:MAG: DUF945 family protein [Legionellaceae bacterium]|nr:DUF945 family protein [Legionellaceae bacterium]